MFNWFKDKFKKKEDQGKEQEKDLEELQEEAEAEEPQKENLEEAQAEPQEDLAEKDEDLSEAAVFLEEEAEVEEEQAEVKAEEPEEEASEEENTDLPGETVVLEEEAEAEDRAEEPEKDREESPEEEEDSEDISEDEKVEEKQEPVEEKQEPKEEIPEDKDEEAFQKEEKTDFFHKLKSGLKKTRANMSKKINQVLGVYVKVDDELLEDLEDVLISSDLGMDTTMETIDRLKEKIVEDEIRDPKDILPALAEILQELLDECALDHTLMTERPTVILVVGVNGVGKTTTIGKLSARLKAEGKTVLIGAADTFRAAAIDQLKTWGQRANVDVISHSEGADPAAVTYDAIQAAKARNVDVLLIDTAGRLHNKANLMKELEKISRIVDREYPQAHRENLLVLDATTGQNAIAQAKTFNEVTNLSGFILTKLDGTAKGGVVIGLQRELKVPIKLIGVGEKINDLQYFDSKDFTQALFEGEELEKSE